MKLILSLAIVVVMFGGAIVGTAATRRPDNPVSAVQVIKLRLSADGKELARISTPNGVMATMSREGIEQIGLTPSVQGDAVSITVAVKDAATGRYKVVGRHSLVRNRPAAVGTERTSLTVEWVETTTVTVTGGAAAAAGLAPCTTCCVSCDGFTFCACEVTTSCGHCCCRETCGCLQGL